MGNKIERMAMYCLTKKITKTRLVLDKWQKENFWERQQQIIGSFLSIGDHSGPNFSKFTKGDFLDSTVQGFVA